MPTAAEVERLKDTVREVRDTSRRRGASLRRFARFADDPVGFIESVTGSRLTEAQKRIAEAVRDHRLTAVRSCNGAGKDFIAARIACWHVLARRGFALITGPTDRQVREVVMGELRRAITPFGPTLPGELLETSWRFDASEPMGVLAFTSNDVSRVTGFHAPRLLVIVTEAQGIEPFAWEGILANTTGGDSRILAVGNPLNPSGKFFEVSRSPQWCSIQLSAFDHTNVVEGREIIPGAVTREFIDLIKREYGEGSGTYKARVLGEFPDENDEGLIRRSWLDAAAKRWEDKALEDEAKGSAVVAALDPARYGPDHSALAVRQGPVLRELAVWAKLDTMETAARVLDELERRHWKPRRRFRLAEEFRGWANVGFGWTDGAEITVDEIGLGAGVLDRLRALDVKADGFNAGRQATEARFLNMRAQAFWHLRKLLEESQIAVPADERLFDELTAIRWVTTPEGKVKLESKDDTRARLGRSPDRADAVAMAFWSYKRSSVPPYQGPVRW
jgi:hypothetical protein